jgi:putative FmdB family regulatory protein
MPPIYEYECDECKHVFEERQEFTDPPIEKCPKCNKKTAKKIISGLSVIQFRGKGQYKDQYYKTASASNGEFSA